MPDPTTLCGSGEASSTVAACERSHKVDGLCRDRLAKVTESNWTRYPDRFYRLLPIRHPQEENHSCHRTRLADPVHPGAVRVAAALVVAGAVTGSVAGCSSSGGGGGTKLSLVAYSTPQQAYAELIPAFDKTADGRGVTFSQSYGASGAQSRAVLAGLKADLVEMSLEPDITKLVDAGLVATSWNSDQYKGMVTDSVAVLVVRKGNPKHIESWSDLTKRGVKVVTPNPFSSGSGTGDVLISYENEAIAARQAGKSVDYVTPRDTILIENPVAVTVNAPDAAKSFVRFPHTDAAQKIFAAKGHRPVVKRDHNAMQSPTPGGRATARPGGHPATRRRHPPRPGAPAHPLGFQARVDTTLPTGEPVVVALTRGHADELALAPNDELFVRTTRAVTFAEVPPADRRPPELRAEPAPVAG